MMLEEIIAKKNLNIINLDTYLEAVAPLPSIPLNTALETKELTELEKYLKTLINLKYADVPLDAFFSISGTLIAGDFGTLADMHDLSSICGLFENRLISPDPAFLKFKTLLQKTFVNTPVYDIKKSLSNSLQAVSIAVAHEKTHSYALFNKISATLYKKLFEKDCVVLKHASLVTAINKSWALSETNNVKRLRYIFDFITANFHLTAEEKADIILVQKLMADPLNSINYYYEDFIIEASAMLQGFCNKFEVNTEFDAEGTSIYVFKSISCNFADIVTKLKELTSSKDLSKSNMLSNIELRIYCEKDLYISKEKFVLPGLSIVCIAPSIIALDNEINICTDGLPVPLTKDTTEDKNGKKGEKSGEPGYRGLDGDNGVYGNAGGNIYFLTSKVVTKQNAKVVLNLSAKGSAGGNGQRSGDGGEGARGAEGRNAPAVAVPETLAKESHSVLCYAYGIPGSKGGRGGNAGNAGARGLGGMSGRVEFYSGNEYLLDENPTQAKSGDPGKPGVGGSGGKNGKNGYDEFLYSIQYLPLNHEQKISRNNSIADAYIEGKEYKLYRGHIEHKEYMPDSKTACVQQNVPIPVNAREFDAPKLIADPQLRVIDEIDSGYFAENFAENGLDGYVYKPLADPKSRSPIIQEDCIEQYMAMLSIHRDYNFSAISLLLKSLNEKLASTSKIFEPAYLVNKRQMVADRKQYYLNSAGQTGYLINYPRNDDKVNFIAYSSMLKQQYNINLTKNLDKHIASSRYGVLKKIRDLYDPQVKEDQAMLYIEKELKSQLANVPPLEAALALDAIIGLASLKRLKLPASYRSNFETLPSIVVRNLNVKYYVYRSMYATSNLDKYGKLLAECDDPYSGSVIDSLFQELNEQKMMLREFIPDWLLALKNAAVEIDELLILIKQFNESLEKDVLAKILEKTSLYFTSGKFLALYGEGKVSLAEFAFFIEVLMCNYLLITKDKIGRLLSVKVGECFHVDLKVIEYVSGMLHTLEIHAQTQSVVSQDHQALIIEIIDKRYNVSANAMLKAKFGQFSEQIFQNLSTKAHVYRDENIGKVRADETSLGDLLDQLERNLVLELLETIPNVLPGWDEIRKKLTAACNIGYDLQIVKCLLLILINPEKIRDSKLLGLLVKQVRPETVYFIGEIIYLSFIADHGVITKFAKSRVEELLMHSGTFDEDFFAGIAYVMRNLKYDFLSGALEMPESYLEQKNLFHGLKNLIPSHPGIPLLEVAMQRSSAKKVLQKDFMKKFGEKKPSNKINYCAKYYSTTDLVVRKALEHAKNKDQFNNTLAVQIVQSKLDNILTEGTASCMLNYALVDNMDMMELVDLASTKFYDYYSQSECGIPTRTFDLIINLIENIGNYSAISNIINNSEPEDWHDQLLKINLQLYLQEKFGDQIDVIEELTVAIEGIDPRFARVLLNKISNYFSKDETEVSKDEQLSMKAEYLLDIADGLSQVPYDTETAIVYSYTKLTEWHELLHRFYLKKFAQQLDKASISEQLCAQAVLNGLYDNQSSKTKNEFMSFVSNLKVKTTKSNPEDVIKILRNVFNGNLELNAVNKIMMDPKNANFIQAVDQYYQAKQKDTYELNIQDIIDYVNKQDPNISVAEINDSASQVLDAYKAQIAECQAQNSVAQWYAKSIISKINSIRFDKEQNKTARQREVIANNFIRFVSDICVAFWHANNKKSLYITQIYTLVALLKTKDAGLLAQVKTGEGKTFIVATFAVAKALANYKVDITTSEETLAFSGNEKSKELFKLCKLTSDLIVRSKGSLNFYKCFNADIVYGTANDFQSSYLGAYSHELNSELYTLRYAANDKCIMVDEADNAMLDKACQMLYLPYIADDVYPLENLDIQLWNAILGITSYETAEVEAELKVIAATMNKLIAEGSILIPEHMHEYCRVQMLDWAKTFYNVKVSKKINTNFRLDLDQPEKFKHSGANRLLRIIDINTGTIEDRMRWNSAAQGLDFRYRSRYQPRFPTCDYISNYKFYKMYGSQIFGLSGTLGNKDARNLLKTHYNVDTVDIPPHMAKRFEMFPATFAFTKQELFEKIKNDFILNAAKKPILAIFEMLEDILAFTAFINIKKPSSWKIMTHFEKLDNIEVALEKIGGANPGDIIIASNKGGRGTDILLGRLASLGLYVIPTFVAESSRVGDQMTGRAGRAGQLGSGRIIARVKPSLINICINKPDDYIAWQMSLEQAEAEKKQLENLSNNIACKDLEERLYDMYKQLRHEIQQLITEEKSKKEFEKMYRDAQIEVKAAIRKLNSKHYSEMPTLPVDSFLYLQKLKFLLSKVHKDGMLEVLRKKWAFWISLNHKRIVKTTKSEEREEIVQDFQKNFIVFYKECFDNDSYIDKILTSGSDYNLAVVGISDCLRKYPFDSYRREPSQNDDVACRLFNVLSAKVNKGRAQYLDAIQVYLDKSIELQETTGHAGYAGVVHAWKSQQDFKTAVRYLKHTEHALNNLKVQMSQNHSIANFVKQSADMTFDLTKHTDYYKLGCEERAGIANLHLQMTHRFIGEKIKVDHLYAALAPLADDESQVAQQENVTAIYTKLISSGIIYENRIKKKWLKKDRASVELILKRRLHGLKQTVDLDNLYPAMFNPSRVVNADAIKHLCYSQDDLWNLLLSSKAIVNSQDIFLIATQRILSEIEDLKIVETLEHLFQKHNIQYKERSLIYCDAGNDFVNDLKNESNASVAKILSKFSMPKRTRIGNFDNAMIANESIYGRYKDLKIYNSKGDIEILPKVLQQIADDVGKESGAQFCEEFLPFKHSKQQADQVIYALHQADFLKSGGFTNKLKHKYKDVVSASLRDALLPGNNFKLTPDHIDALAVQCMHIHHAIYGLEGDKFDVEMLRFSDIFGDREEPYELEHYFAGLHMREFVYFNSYKFPKNDGMGAALICALIGVVQIVVGAILTVCSAGTLALVGQYLIREGIGDLVYAAMAAQRGYFSWEEWYIHKAISMAISIICFSIDYYAQVLQEGNNVAVARETAEKFTFSETLLNASRDVILRILENVVTDAAIEAALRILSQKLTAELMNKVCNELPDSVRQNIDELFAKSKDEAEFRANIHKLKHEVCVALRSNPEKFKEFEQTRTRLREAFTAVRDKFDNIRSLESAPSFVQRAVATGKILLIINSIFEVVKPILQASNVSQDVKNALDQFVAKTASEEEKSRDENSLNQVTAEFKKQVQDEIMHDIRGAVSLIVDAEISYRTSQAMKICIEKISRFIEKISMDEMTEVGQRKGVEELQKNKKSSAEDIAKEFLTDADTVDDEPANNEQIRKNSDELKLKRVQKGLKQEPKAIIADDANDLQEAAVVLRDASESALIPAADQNVIRNSTPEEIESLRSLQRQPGLYNLFNADSLDDFEPDFFASKERKNEDKLNNEVADEISQNKKKADNARKNAKKPVNKEAAKKQRQKQRRDANRNESDPNSSLYDVDKQKISDKSVVAYNLYNFEKEYTGDPLVGSLFTPEGKIKVDLTTYSDPSKKQYGFSLKNEAEFSITGKSFKNQSMYGDTELQVSALAINLAANASMVFTPGLPFVKQLEFKFGGDLHFITIQHTYKTPVQCFLYNSICTSAELKSKAGLGVAAQIKGNYSSDDKFSSFSFKGGASLGFGPYFKLKGSLNVYLPYRNPEMREHLNRQLQNQNAKF